jgi:transposase-like protein
VFLRINGQLHSLWRAVEQHGVVLDILIQDQRNGNAAKWFFKRLLADLKYKPRRLVTDGLHVRPHVLDRHEPHVVTERVQLAGPVVRGVARLDPRHCGSFLKNANTRARPRRRRSTTPPAASIPCT